MSPSSVGREQIESVEPLIRPYIRRTPVVEVDGRDLGLPGVTLVLKLELLQQSGSFKARGAFANLLLRRVPAVGVVAASGGNHGAAVARAARELRLPARIYVPRIRRRRASRASRPASPVGSFGTRRHCGRAEVKSWPRSSRTTR
jgi:threonine dehydratase